LVHLSVIQDVVDALLLADLLTYIEWDVWLCADKHLSVIIQGDVDVARAMEQTSTITRQLTFCVLPLTTVFLSLSLHCTIRVLPGTCSYWIVDVHLYKLFRDNFVRRQKKHPQMCATTAKLGMTVVSLCAPKPV